MAETTICAVKGVLRRAGLEERKRQAVGDNYVMSKILSERFDHR
jgi:hypothetical protein